MALRDGVVVRLDGRHLAVNAHVPQTAAETIARRLHTTSTRTVQCSTSLLPSRYASVEYALPSSVRSAPSLLQFRRDLNTALHVSVIVLFTVVSGYVTDCNF